MTTDVGPARRTDIKRPPRRSYAGDTEPNSQVRCWLDPFSDTGFPTWRPLPSSEALFHPHRHSSLVARLTARMAPTTGSGQRRFARAAMMPHQVEPSGCACDGHVVEAIARQPPASGGDLECDCGLPNQSSVHILRDESPVLGLCPSPSLATFTLSPAVTDRDSECSRNAQRMIASPSNGTVTSRDGARLLGWRRPRGLQDRLRLTQ
jgi:hypothetical protein